MKGIQSVEDFYSGIQSAAEESQFLNLGYWKARPLTLDEASVALVALVAETADMGPRDRVLDLGFGMGDQDLFWSTHPSFSPREIIGLNVTESQVLAARERVCERGLEGRIRLYQGSATDIHLETGSVDKVIAVECALHFDTREDFFREAYRVLRPGGKLVTTDILTRQGSPACERVWSDCLLSIFWHVPMQNLYDADGCARRLTAAGFDNVRVEDISEDVFPGAIRCMRRRLRSPEIVWRMNPVWYAYWAWLLADPKGWPKFRRWNDYQYVLCSAEKPDLFPGETQ